MCYPHPIWRISRGWYRGGVAEAADEHDIARVEQLRKAPRVNSPHRPSVLHVYPWERVALGVRDSESHSDNQQKERAEEETSRQRNGGGGNHRQ